MTEDFLGDASSVTAEASPPRAQPSS
jgi:hypothetical protein